MIKYYVKTLTIVIFLSGFIVILYQSGFSYFTKNNSHQINQLISKGTFSYLQEKLSKKPEADWQSTLKSVQPKNTPLAQIVPINLLQLTRNDRSKLLDRKIVFESEKGFHFQYFLFYGVFQSFAVQRIGSSQYALKIMLTAPINQTIKNTTRWVAHIILNELNKTPEKNWTIALNHLQKTFGLPLHIIFRNSSSVTHEIRHDLKTYAVAYREPEADQPITTIYFQTTNPQKLLMIGPIHYEPLSSLFSVAEQSYFISFILASILLVIFLTWLFGRNVLKIYRLTQKYSQGEFDACEKISRTSILHGIYQDVLAMGSNLSRLMRSQQNMTRFVAHEVRTPLATMQLALDSLKKDSNLTVKSQENLASIQEDIRDINKLISYFFLYQQGASQKLKCKPENLNLTDFMESIVKRYSSCDIKVIFNLLTEEEIILNADPSLLKHAIDNFLTNALKHAKEKILVSLESDQNQIQIIVEDDGQGILETDIEAIFEPFNTLYVSQSFGKHIGLGLAIAKFIVEWHKGKIIVSNGSEGGARFTILLPRK